MFPKAFVVAAAMVGACGGSSDTPAPLLDAGAAHPAIDAPADTSVTYAAMVDATPPVAFGATEPQPTFCSYTITLEQLAVEFGVTPDGRVTRAHVQDNNVEVVTSAGCTLATIAPNLAQYTMTSSRATDAGPLVLFQGGATNHPNVTLTAQLSSLTSAPQAVLTFHRNDIGAPFDWTVTATLPLTPP